MAIFFDTDDTNIELATPPGPPGLVIEQRRRPEIIEAEVAWTKGGRQVRWERAKKDVPLDLVGGDDWGWLPASTIAALQALAEIPNPATPYVLSYQGIEYDVFWRFEDPPVIECEPLVMLVSEHQYYRNIRLKFMRVLS